MVELAGLLSNPQVATRRFRFSQDPEPVENPLRDFFLAILDPEFVELTNKLIKLIERSKRSARAPASQSSTKPPQGQILRMIKTVMLEHPDGLHTYEARALVEERLGRKLPKSTVKDALASHPETFKRIGYGKYRVDI